MNRTMEELKTAYVERFIGTAVCVAGSIGASRLIWLGKTGDNFWLAVGIAAIGGYIGCKGTIDLCRRWRQFKQLSVVREHGPYGNREYVPPSDAARQVGENGSNIWG